MRILGFFMDILKDILAKLITFCIVAIIILLLVNYFLGVNILKFLF